MEAQLTTAVADGFASRFDVEATGVWSAPGRVNLIGEHTDYNDGHVLPFAIDRRTAVALRLRDDQRIRVASALGGEVVEADLRELGGGVAGWAAYPLGTAWALGRAGVDLAQAPGFDAYFVSDVPVGAGLSSSAAIECALAVGLDELWNAGLDRDALVEATRRAENDVVGAPTGILDQSASLLCEPDAALFLDCRDRSHSVVPLGLDAAGLSVLVVDTGVEHAHADGGYAERRASCEAAARTLGLAALRELSTTDLHRLQVERRLDAETFRRVRHVVTEDERVLATVRALEHEGPRAVGPLLLASHASLRDDFEVSVPELDVAVEAAVAAGALGARMTGGGFGGSALALVEHDDVVPVGDAVREAFAAKGFKEPHLFEVRPSPGAARDV